jgi:site-specific DNA-methyltransferase (cytosine-N4-specific)
MPISTGSVCQGDAFDLIEQIPDHSIDLILTSPPYWGLRTYGLEYNAATHSLWESMGNTRECAPPYEWYRGQGGILGLEPFPSWYVSNLVEILRRLRRVLKPSGSVWLNLGDTYFARWSSIRDEGGQGQRSKTRQRRITPAGGYLHDKQLLLVPARVAIAAQDDGWIVRNDLIWSKPNAIPRPENDRLRLTHEHWFHFVIRDSGRRPTYYYDLEGAEPGANDVVTCATEKGAFGHSATFPSALVRPRILSSSPPV